MCSWLLIQSLLGALVAFCMGRGVSDTAKHTWGRGMSLVSCVMVIAMWWRFDARMDGFQWTEDWSWIETLGAKYSLGVDGLSLAMLAMTVMVTWSVVWLREAFSDDMHMGIGYTFLTQAVAVGLFTARDGLLFYLFWEASLIPLFLAIGTQGSKHRQKAAVKYFMFTFFASALFLVALVYLGIKADDYQIEVWTALPLSVTEQLWLFTAVLFAALVKLPAVPLHSWLPEAHPEAPTYGSMLLAATMLKFGAYLLLRIALPVFPDAASYASGGMLLLALLTLWYAGSIAWVEEDAKRLIAFSSIAHMAVAVIGIFVVYWVPESAVSEIGTLALIGVVFQMVAHALSASGLFGGFGLLYSRLHTRKLSDLGGVAKTMPVFSALYVCVAMNNIALPGTSAFVGEFFIALATFQAHPLLALIAATSLLVTAMYTLQMVKRIFFGPVVEVRIMQLQDPSVFQTVSLWGIVAVSFAIGLYPSVLGDALEKSMAATLSSAIHFKHDGKGD